MANERSNMAHLRQILRAAIAVNPPQPGQVKGSRAKLNVISGKEQKLQAIGDRFEVSWPVLSGVAGVWFQGRNLDGLDFQFHVDSTSFFQLLFDPIVLCHFGSVNKSTYPPKGGEYVDSLDW